MTISRRSFVPSVISCRSVRCWKLIVGTLTYKAIVWHRFLHSREIQWSNFCALNNLLQFAEIIPFFAYVNDKYLDTWWLLMMFIRKLATHISLFRYIWGRVRKILQVILMLAFKSFDMAWFLWQWEKLLAYLKFSRTIWKPCSRHTELLASMGVSKKSFFFYSTKYPERAANFTSTPTKKSLVFSFSQPVWLIFGKRFHFDSNSGIWYNY